MIAPPPGVRVWLAAGVTDMRRGFDGLAAMVQQNLALDPFSGQLFVFRGRRGHLLKILFWDGQGLVLYAKRLGARQIRLAACEGRRGVTDAGAVVDADGRDRLAHACAHVAARDGGLKRDRRHRFLLEATRMRP
jgi:transposase